MPSQGAEVGRSVLWRVERGQASPREVESRVVREAGQMGARPSIRRDQRTGRGTMGMEDARVRGWERR
jgi:hypothetical protein